jgi:hypothetical protein
MSEHHTETARPRRRDQETTAVGSSLRSARLKEMAIRQSAHRSCVRTSSNMPPSDPLLVRIRGEYREMPGLRLSLAQACRLWQVDAVTCERVLHRLVAEGFLFRTIDGAFIAWRTSDMRPAKARLPFGHVRRSA